MDSKDVIRVSHAVKLVRGRFLLDDVSLAVPRGGVYGFTGANGSGKTILLKTIAGLVHLTSGAVEVFGDKVGEDCSFPPNMGCMFGSPLWDEYSGLRNLQLLASVRKRIGDKEIKRTLARVGLDPNDERRVRTYSLGMRQRLDLAQAIMERPELLILDEPSNALDARGLELLCEIVEQENARGATVLLAAHNTPELTALCHRTFELSEGQLVGSRPASTTVARGGGKHGKHARKEAQ